jgi:hypothetical protein
VSQDHIDWDAVFDAAVHMLHATSAKLLDDSLAASASPQGVCADRTRPRPPCRARRT